jgi:hypothetical protein
MVYKEKFMFTLWKSVLYSLLQGNTLIRRASFFSHFFPLYSRNNLAEAHQDKTPATQLKSTTNVMALGTKIQTFFRK